MYYIKACTACKVEFPATTEFFHRSKYADGLTAKCKSCRSLQRKKHYQANKDRILKQCHEYYTNNKAAHLKLTAAWRAKNKERAAFLSKEWGRKHPERKSIYKAARRAREAQSGGFLIKSKEMKRLYASSCAACGSMKSIEADHIIPIALGGRTSIGNLQPLCKSCNCSKGSKLMSEWRYRTSDTID